MNKIKHIGIIFCFVISSFFPVRANAEIIHAWSMLFHDSQHSGQSEYIGTTINNLKWRFPTSDPCDHPILSNDTVYFPSGEKLYALNLNGTLKWMLTEIISPTVPVLEGDTIYVGGNDGLYALDTTGAIKWKFPTGTVISESPTIGKDGTIYFGCGNKLYAVTSDGSPKWFLDTGSDVGIPTIDQEETIYVVTGSKLCALNALGNEIWSIEGDWCTLPSVGPDGTIYIRDGNFVDAVQNNDGSIKWRADTSWIANIGLVNGNIAVSTNSTVYVGGWAGMYNGYLYAINPNGNLKWRFHSTGHPYGYIQKTATIGGDGTVYIASAVGNGTVYALDPSNGTIKCSFRLPLSSNLQTWNGIAIGCDGIIYIGGQDGLYAFGISSKLTVFPISHDFDSLKCELETDTQTFTLTNTGDSSITVNTISLSGANSSEFSIKNDNCSGRTISPSGTATFDVVFSPQTAGNKTASISIDSNDMGSPITVPLAGEGVLTTVVKVDNAPFGFIDGEEITFRADTWGAQPQNLTYQWDLDNDGIKDDSMLPKPSKSWNDSGTHLVGVEVADSVSGETATNWIYVAINKMPVTGEPTIDHPAIDILAFVDITDIDKKFYGSDGNQFTFDPTKKNNGLIIITHGIWASATEATSLTEPRSWLEIMAQDINQRLPLEGKSLPNIALYDWEEMSLPDNFGGTPWLWGIDDLLLIRPYGLAEGLILADWIIKQEEVENINTAQPIHIIGHSAGGFVAGNCAEVLLSKIKQITLLDTPIPTGNTNFLDNNGKIDCYISLLGARHSSWIDSLQQIHSTMLWWPLSHSYAYEWYDDTVKSDTPDGFYYSPWLGNPFPESLSRMYQTIKEQLQTIEEFQTFGSVSLFGGDYTITEGDGNAGILKTIDFPENALTVTFRYRFTIPGDGDFLTVHLKEDADIDTLLYIGPDLQISRDNYINGEVDVTEMADKTGQLIFKLISRGEQNAVVSVDSINLVTTSSDNWQSPKSSKKYRGTVSSTNRIRAEDGKYAGLGWKKGEKTKKICGKKISSGIQVDFGKTYEIEKIRVTARSVKKISGDKCEGTSCNKGGEGQLFYYSATKKKWRYGGKIRTTSNGEPKETEITINDRVRHVLVCRCGNNYKYRNLEVDVVQILPSGGEENRYYEDSTSELDIYKLLDTEEYE